MNLNLTGKHAQYRMILMIPLIVFTLGMIIPLFIGFYYSLTDWNGLSRTYNFIGFSNYLKILDDSKFFNSMEFTLYFMLFNTIINNLAALLFAMVLDADIRAKKFFRTIIFVPVLISPILVGHIWRQMYGTVLPSLNQFLGTSINFSLFSHPDTVLAGLLVANNWQWIGYWMIIYLAALQTIPKDLYEAGTVDGANKWQKFSHITFPMLAPAITICTVGITVGSLRVFELIVTATGGGPAKSSEAMVLYIFNTGFGASRASYASSMSIVFLMLLLLIAFALLTFLRRRETRI